MITYLKKDITTDERGEIMNNQVLNNGDVVYYGLKVDGKLVSSTFSERLLAEQYKLQLWDRDHVIAEVVTVTASGQELLLG